MYSVQIGILAFKRVDNSLKRKEFPNIIKLLIMWYVVWMIITLQVLYFLKVFTFMQCLRFLTYEKLKHQTPNIQSISALRMSHKKPEKKRLLLLGSWVTYGTVINIGEL